MRCISIPIEEFKRYIQSLELLEFDINQSIHVKDEMIKLLDEETKPKEPTRILVGTLTKPFGLVGYTTAGVGAPIFELNERYYITLYNSKGEEHIVPFYKATLEPHINKI